MKGSRDIGCGAGEGRELVVGVMVVTVVKLVVIAVVKLVVVVVVLGVKEMMSKFGGVRSSYPCL